MNMFWQISISRVFGGYLYCVLCVLDLNALRDATFHIQPEYLAEASIHFQSFMGCINMQMNTHIHTHIDWGWKTALGCANKLIHVAFSVHNRCVSIQCTNEDTLSLQMLKSIHTNTIEIAFEVGLLLLLPYFMNCLASFKAAHFRQAFG